MDHIEALLYEHAPRARELWLSTLPDRDEVPGHTFSRRFERRMAQLLRRQQRSPRMNQALLVLKRTVAAVLVLITVSFAGLMTVEAFRNRVIQMVVQVFEELTEFRYRSTSTNTEIPEVIFGYIPEGMEETTRTIRPSVRTHIKYEDGAGGFFDLRQTILLPGDAYTKILNTEDAITENITVRGHEAIANFKSGNSTILWSEGNVLYRLYGNIDMETMKEIAYQLKIKEPTVPTARFAYIPEGMQEVICETYNDLHSWYLYEEAGGYHFDLRLSVITRNTWSNKILDTEDAVTEKWILRGNEVTCATKNGEHTLLWSDGNILFTLSGNIALGELKNIASQMVLENE